MAVTAQAIIDKAVIQLTDLTAVRWTRAELLKWLNDGQRQIVVVQPTASNEVVSLALAAGTRQSLPADGWLLLDVYRYMGTDGLTPGSVVRLVSRALLDSFNLNWHSATATAKPTNYLYDTQDQRAFFVYPPNTGTGYIQINYSRTPANLTSESSTISILDIYEPILLDYIMYRACSKDAEYAPGVELSKQYLATFSAALAGKDAAEKANTPNNALFPFNPNVPGSEP